jgi:cell wall-associated NlpC family hydrolase
MGRTAVSKGGAGFHASRKTRARLPGPRASAIVGVILLGACLGSEAIWGSIAAATAPSSEPQAPGTDRVAVALGQSPSRLRYDIYQARPGDTVENIAARFGVSARQIREVNGLDAPHQLRTGESLAIVLPSGAAATSLQRAQVQGAHSLEPHYARVTAASPIVADPTRAAGEQVLYEAAPGAQLVVNAEQDAYWGVVMIDGSTGWIAKSAVEIADEAVPPDKLEILLKGGRPDIVQSAFRFLGTRYRYGGQLPHDVDCSLLVQTAFAARGIRLPRTAAAQYEHGRSVHSAEMLPGDRLYFVGKSGRINHTGIYIGNGQFIHASAQRQCVAVDSLTDRLYWTRFLGAKRS